MSSAASRMNNEWMEPSPTQMTQMAAFAVFLRCLPSLSSFVVFLRCKVLLTQIASFLRFASNVSTRRPGRLPTRLPAVSTTVPLFGTFGERFGKPKPTRRPSRSSWGLDGG